MNKSNPMWVAPLTGQDWRDEDALRATTWLRSFVPSRECERRIEAIRDQFVKARGEWTAGRPGPLHDARDVAAWYIFQAETYAVDRQYWVPEVSAQIAPIMARIGQELPLLQTIRGVEERAARLMTTERRQPDSGLFELLVALAYRRGGWSEVAFVPERPGVERTPDLTVTRPRRRWAVECKRLGASTFAMTEKARGEALAMPVHDLSLAADRSIVLEVVYHQELASLADDHLSVRAAAYLADRREAAWTNSASTGRIRDIDWHLARRVLRDDFVYFGSSRLIELLVGRYDHEGDHSMAAKWRPARERPLYADAVYQASVVSWWSRSTEAIARKARHFRSTLARANGQLPSDMPSAIHVGIESWSGQTVASTRHILNWLESRHFEPTGSRLRRVYGNYFAPEATTRPNESWAVNETMAPYKIGRHSTAEPLPGHLLVAPEAYARDGVHWDGLVAGP
jgi:hypothetical protein